MGASQQQQCGNNKLWHLIRGLKWIKERRKWEKISFFYRVNGTSLLLSVGTDKSRKKFFFSISALLTLWMRKEASIEISSVRWMKSGCNLSSRRLLSRWIIIRDVSDSQESTNDTFSLKEKSFHFPLLCEVEEKQVTKSHKRGKEKCEIIYVFA